MGYGAGIVATCESMPPKSPLTAAPRLVAVRTTPSVTKPQKESVLDEVLAALILREVTKQSHHVSSSFLDGRRPPLHPKVNVTISAEGRVKGVPATDVP